MIERAELGQLRKKHFASTIPTPGTLLSRSSFSLKVGLHSMVSSRSWSVRASSFSSHRMCARMRLPTASDGLNETSNGNEIMTHFRVNRRVYGVRKLWHALRRAVWSWPARLMRNAGISGVVCAAATPRPRPSVVIDRRRGIRICMSGRGTPPRVGTSGGWPTSPTCGCWRSSATSRC